MARRGGEYDTPADFYEGLKTQKGIVDIPIADRQSLAGEKRWPARLHRSGPNEAILTGWMHFYLPRQNGLGSRER